MTLDPDVEVTEEQPEPEQTGPLLRDPPPPPGYVDPLEESELLEEGLPASDAAPSDHFHEVVRARRLDQ